ncbi:MAG: DUF3108 domain-containing protein [Bacteroidales bacterium]|nr:DUF3108 domain-containing protein [Bacteroidales bacterium]
MLKIKFILVIGFVLSLLGRATSQESFMGENGYVEGEKFLYVIFYGPITGGQALVTLEKETMDGKEIYHAKAFAKTTGVADALYKVRDIYESFFEIETGLPIKSVRNIKEGDYKKLEEHTFNRTNNTVVNNKNEVHEVPPGILDMVTALYKVRRIDRNKIKVGDVVKIVTFFDNEVFPFDITYKGKETITTKMGTYKCLKFVPKVGTGRIFENEDDMTIWISDDPNLLPVRVKFDLKVGSIKCDVIEYEGLKY